MHINNPIVLSILVISCCLTSCESNDQESVTSVDKKTEITTIHSVMMEQQRAWNQADLEGFMEPYWKSDSLKFIGKRGITYGWQSTLDNYKKGYSTPEEMGKLQFTNITTDILNDSAAFVIGQWQLFRSSDTLTGYYTLLWKKMDKHWVIIADHSS